MYNSNMYLNYLKAMRFSLLFILFFSQISLLFAQNTASNEQATTQIQYSTPFILTESPISLFNYKIGDSEVEFITDGYWEAVMSSSVNLTFSDDNPVILDYTPFLFSQEVDLSVWFLLQNQWYFEGVFADGFEKNTIAAGYYGNNYVKHIRLGNRNITIPEDYSIEGIGGGSEQSPGIMAEFGGENWKANSLVRYDALTTKTKTFSGNNEIYENEVSISNWEKGRNFYVGKNISKLIKNIYVESTDGEFSDSTGKKYRLLANSEFLILGSTGTITLSKNYSGNVLAEYYSSSKGLDEKAQTITELGTLSSGNTGVASGFLGNLENYFGSNSEQITSSLAKYMGIENSFDNLFKTIIQTNSTCLVLQQDSLFSPFWDASYYQLSSNKVEYVSLVSQFSDSEIQEYSILLIDNEQTSLLQNTISTRLNNDYAQVYLSEKSSNEFSTRFPFANTLPQIYLSNKTASNNEVQKKVDYIIKEKSFTPITKYSIGSDAIPGTIKVYRNNILDTTTKYNSETGCLTFITLPTSTEKIYVTWQEVTDENSNGVISTAFGFNLSINKNSFFTTSLSSQWIAPWLSTYDEGDQTSAGFVKSTSKYQYQNEKITFSDKLTASFDVTNSTGLYKISSFDDGEPEEIGFSENNFKQTTTNILPSLNSLNGETYPNLSSSTRNLATTLSSATNTELVGKEITLSWDKTFSSSSLSDNSWSAYSIDLGSSGSLLQGAEQFEIQLKTNKYLLNNIQQQAKYSVYLQLGIDSDEDITQEDTTLIPTWKISKATSTDVNNTNVISSFILSNDFVGEWQTIKIKLTDIEKSRISKNFDCRLIIIQEEESVGDNITSSISIGDCRIPQSVFAIDSQIPATTYQTINTTTLNDDVTLFNNDKNNYAQLFSWTKNIGQDFSTVKFYKFIESTDLSYYKKLNLYFYIPTDSSITDTKIILDQPTSYSTTNTALSIFLPYDTLIKYKSGWHLLSVDMNTNEIFIDDTNSSLKATINTSIIPSRFILELSENSLHPFSTSNTSTGQIILDELYLSQSNSILSLSNDINFSYTEKNDIIKINDYSLLSDFHFTSNVQSTIQNKTTNNYLLANYTTGVNFAGILFNITGSEKITPDYFSTYNGSHSINTTNKLLKYINFTEDYLYYSENSSITKNNNISLSIPIYNRPIILSTSTKAVREYNQLEQSYQGNFSFSFPIAKSEFITTSTYTSLQNLKNNYDYTNYFNDWYDISSYQFTNGFENANKRNQLFTITQLVTLPIAQLKPSITFNGKTLYTNSSSTSNNSSGEFLLQIPFQISKNNFTFSWIKKSSLLQTVTSGGDYLFDNQYLFSSLSYNDWFFTTLPIYDLFSSDLLSTIQSTNNNNYNNSYYSTYKFFWTRPVNSKWFDFFVPSSLQMATNRTISTDSLGNTIDKTQLQSSIGFSGINLFGSKSSLSLFKFYEQDEFVNSFSASFDISNLDNTLVDWNISDLCKYTLFLNKNNSLQQLTEIQFQNDNLWNIKTKFTWTRAPKNSIVTNMILSLFPSLSNKKIILERENFLKYNIGYDEELSQGITINHSLQMSFGKYVSIKLSLESGLSFSDTKALSTNIASITGKLSF